MELLRERWLVVLEAFMLLSAVLRGLVLCPLRDAPVLELLQPAVLVAS